MMKFGLTLIKRGLNYHKRNKMAEYTTQELQEMLDQQMIDDLEASVVMTELETFIEGISFNKLRHEVEERGLSFLNDLNSSLSEISLKLTALPASFGVWVFFARNDQNLMSMLGFLVAIVMMTLLLNNSLKGLFEKLIYIENMIERQVKSFSQRSNSAGSLFESSKVKDDITDLKVKLGKRVSSVESHLQFYRFILWMPVVIMLGVFLYQYSLTEFWDFAVTVASCLPIPNQQ